MKVRQYKDILLECLVTLRHARTFVTSREKMHPTGIKLYDDLIIEVADALNAPEPCSEMETRLEPHAVPPGYFWRGEINRSYCKHCGGHYDQHLHTDEASRCPPAETLPAPEPPEKTWDCVCGRSNYVTYTRCGCGFQRATTNR